MSRVWAALRSMVYAPAFLAAWGWVALRCRPLDQYIPLRVPSWLVVPGEVLGVAGAAVALTTIVLFVMEGRGTPAVFDPPRKFVPLGPYRFVRNPMYVGGLSMLLGWALYLRSIAMVLYAVGAFLLIHIFIVFVEEPGLRLRFRQEYEDYLKTVPRWVPRLMRRHPAR